MEQEKSLHLPKSKKRLTMTVTARQLPISSPIIIIVQLGCMIVFGESKLGGQTFRH